MIKRTFRPASAIIALIALLVLASPVIAAKDGGNNDGGGGANANGNQGSVKVVDADSGLEPTDDNDPHVCAFHLIFEATGEESGAWSIVDWPPTGTGVVVTSGSYAVPAHGSYATQAFDLAAGHYRVNWQAVNGQNEKHKTFWVDECSPQEPEDVPTDEPTDEPTDVPTDVPADEPTDGPTDEPADGPEGDVEESVEGSGPPAEGPDPTDVQQPDETTLPEGDMAPAADPVVDELPDSATMPPAFPGAAAALGILLLLLAHRALWDRGRVRP